MKKGKTNNLGRRILSIVLTVALVVGLMPGNMLTVKAEESTSTPLSVTAFATPEQLMSSFDLDGTEDTVGKVQFGTNTNGDSTVPQTWYIAGSDAADSIVLLCDPTLPMATGTMFEIDSESNKPYSDDWSCTYETAPSVVYPNHYGASDLRLTTLKGLESSAFSASEQNMMLKTTIYTQDENNSSTYSTTDKLYAAYGDNAWSNDTYTYITVGANSADSLNGGLKVSLSSAPYNNGGYFWLRAPSSQPSNHALVVNTEGSVERDVISGGHSVVPAFRLNLSSVLFASAAPAATSAASLTDTMTFRVDDTEKIKSKAAYATCGVTVNYDEGDGNVFLYVQDADSVYSVEITRDTIVALSDMTGINNLTDENTKIWLEKSEDNVAYAVMAEAKENHIDDNGDDYCDNCGVIYNGIGAHLAGYSVSLNGSIGVNFHMDLTQDVLDDNEAYMLFTLPNGTTQKVMVSDAKAKESAVIEGKTYYIFTCNVAAKEITDTIQAQLITSDGSKTQVYEYSVREYADTILSGNYDAETLELVKAMLHYGAYSQEWFDYNTTNLANAGLDILDLSEADDWDGFDPIITNDDEVGSFTSAYLTLESDTAINLKFKLADGVSFEDLRVVVQDPLGNVVPVTTDTTENVCLITLTGIKASDLDTTYDFSVTDGEGNESYISYSAMSYACAVAKSEMDQKLKNVTAALRIFNLRANEKFEY
ncbi:MAG: hypothetical protein IJD40_05945 [Lachnospiraceae bacterium]|nr:hypothetical protein [Lachnospiraceae bacterium]